jgi:hypothetical protein
MELLRLQLKKWAFILASIVYTFYSGTMVYATSSPTPSFDGIIIPNQEPKEDYKEQLKNVGNRFIEDMSPLLNNAINILFTILFLWGIWKMVYAMITKQGRVMKASTAVLVSTPLVLISIRVMFIIMLSSDVSNASLLGEDIITLLTKVGYITSIGLLTLTLFNRFIFRLINHPEFQRRSKTFLGISIILIVLTTVIPGVLKGI